MLRRLFEPITSRAITFETRVKIAVLALLVLSAMSENVRQLAGMLRLGVEPSLDEVSRHEKRLEPLKMALPQRGVVGYVTDAATSSEIAKRRSITSYALAPLIVVRGAGHPLVVGDFTDAAAARRHFGAAPPLREDFGDGVVLFEQEVR